MKPVNLTFLLAALLALPAIVLSGNRAAVADMQALTPVLCNRLYLPNLLSGGAADQADIIIPPSSTAVTPDCAGFPDFNGDGYADLAIGAPRKGNFDTGIVQVVYGGATGLNAGSGAVINDQIWDRTQGGVPAEQNDLYGSAIALGDFNDDGYDDLAVGIPGAEIAGLAGAGAVQVIYGSKAGLTNAGIQEWSLAAAGINGSPELNGNFGAALTGGDFDGDGYDDLAIGVPRANSGGDTYAGAVNVLYGRSSGLSVLKNEQITQDTSGYIASSTEPFDYFGWSLAAGDFDGNGVDDLAVGTPFEDNGAGFADAGAVQIFFGKRGSTAANSGLLINGGVENPQNWRSDSPNVEGAMEENDRFGFALAAADFDGDGYDDLAIGIPFETHGSGPGALTHGGAVSVIMGSAGGLAATPSEPGRLWHQDLTGMNGAVGTSDRFGFALAAADFDNDGYADLAVGAPQDDYVLGIVDTGGVQLIYGSTDGLTAAGNSLYYHPDLATGDSFGAALSAADFNGDGGADLAVGAPLDTPGGGSSGAVVSFYSSGALGLLQNENQTWYPGSNGLTGTPFANDFFGEALPGSPRQ